jgi:predicted dehydrogenase
VTLRAAVVGTGFGCLTHVRALRAAGVSVDALVGRDPGKTAARAARFDIPNACTSLDDALAVGVDAVTIATPPHTHAPLVLEAIAAGKHVLCEKPFARDAAEAQAMLQAAAAAGVVHLVGTEFRYAPGRVLLARSVRAGAIGTPRLATFLLHIPLLADPTAEVPEWWSDAAQGGGWLGAQGSHDIDQIRTALGEFATVTANLPRVVDRGWSAEDAFLVQFRLRNGCVGVMQSVASDRGPMLFATRVAGTRGTVWAEGDRVRVADATGTHDVPCPPELEVAPPDPPPADLMHSAYDLLHSTGIDLGPYTKLAATFRDLILGVPVAHDPAPPTFADGVATMRVLDAIRISARDGSTVEVAAE